MDDAKQKALDTATQQLEKQFGKGIIMKLGASEKRKIPYIPTGVLTLDIALGIGGYPRGRIVEIYGAESSGKTTLTLCAIAEAQKMGGTAAFIDAEHALDPLYAERLGVDIENLYISQPDFGEQALDIVDALVRSGAVDMIVVDSVAALVPRAEIEGEMEDQQIGLQARLMSKALRKLSGIVSKSNTIVIFINQIRMKIGVMFGNPETTTGGNALKFYSSVRIEVRKGESLKQSTDIYGNVIKMKVVKNKVAPPFRRAEVILFYKEGISRESCLLDVAVENDIISRSGTWYSYGNDKLGQGKENSIKYLSENPEVAKEVEIKIREAFDLSIPDSLKSGNDDSSEEEEQKSTSSKTTKKKTTSRKRTTKKKSQDELI